MSVDYLIFCFEGEPVIDALPIMKITHYPYETESYKPFAQGIVCMRADCLLIRLWAFEAKPEAVSELAVAIKGSGGLFKLSARLDGSVNASLDGVAALLPLEVRPIAGEDLQGEYWGVDIKLSQELTQAIGVGAPGNGDLLYGNIYKLCEGSRPHFGSFFPVPGRDTSACPAAFATARF